jgi:hypothetical protein
MSPEDFCSNVETLVRQGQIQGLSPDEMVTELQGIIDGLEAQIEPDRG